MHLTDMTTDQFTAFTRTMNEPLTDAHRAVAADLGDLLLALGGAAEDPIVRPRLIDAVLAAVPAGVERMRVLWHAQRGVLAAAIAEDQGVPEDLITAEARQRLAIGDMAAIGLAEAEAAEAERIRLAREHGWCVELECRNRPTDCTDACCWHCGRGHRATFAAAQAAAEEADA